MVTIYYVERQWIEAPLILFGPSNIEKKNHTQILLIMHIFFFHSRTKLTKWRDTYLNHVCNTYLIVSEQRQILIQRVDMIWLKTIWAPQNIYSIDMMSIVNIHTKCHFGVIYEHCMCARTPHTYMSILYGHKELIEYEMTRARARLLAKLVAKQKSSYPFVCIQGASQGDLLQLL